MPKKKHRWATAKGKVVGVRFSDVEYTMVAERAFDRKLSPGEYLKWLFRNTTDQGGVLDSLEELEIVDEHLFVDEVELESDEGS